MEQTEPNTNYGWIRIRLHAVFKFLSLSGASLVPTDGDWEWANSLIPRLLPPERFHWELPHIPWSIFSSYLACSEAL